jgi:hypothetical protein
VLIEKIASCALLRGNRKIKDLDGVQRFHIMRNESKQAGTRILRIISLGEVVSLGRADTLSFGATKDIARTDGGDRTSDGVLQAVH